jgi:excisionase family DNA binding protein
MAKLLTTSEAAKTLKISVPRIHQLIAGRRLPAKKFGRDYLINESDLAKVRVRKPGRPKKKG